MNDEEISKLVKEEKIKFITKWNILELEINFDKKISLDKKTQFVVFFYFWYLYNLYNNIV